MASADGSIVIKAEVDARDAQKELNKLENKIKQTEDTISDLQKKRKEADETSAFKANELDAEKAKLKEIKDRLAEIKQLSSDKSIPLFQRNEYKAQLPTMKDEYAEQRERVRALQSEYNKVANSVSRYDEKLKDANAALDKQKARAGELVKEITAAGSASVKMAEAQARVEKSAQRFAGRMGELAKSALFFTVVSQGLSMLRSWLWEVISANSEASAAVSQLKGALLTLVQPLANVVIPVFTAFVNVLTAVVSAIARIVSILFGSSVQKSKKAAQGYGKQAAAISGVGKAAEEAAGSLASFDEINTISTENAAGSGSGGGGGGIGDDGLAADFSALDKFNTEEYKQKVDEITAYVSGALLALGAILAFSGVNIPLGLALMAAGALGLVAVIKENWDELSGKVMQAVTKVLLILGVSALVIGAILAFSGVNLPLGLGLMLLGAASLATAAALNWDTMSEKVKTAVNAVMLVIGGALLVFGAIFAFSGANVPLGIGMMIIGAATLASEAALNWYTIPNEIRDAITTIALMVSTALIVFGVILTLSGANVTLGLGLIIAGIATAAMAAELNWETVPGNVGQTIQKIALIVGTAFLALGAVLALSGVKLALGIALMAVGAASLITVAALNWDSIVTAIQGPLGTIIAVASGFLLALGLILCLSGVGIPLGIALIAAGAVGLVSVTAINWSAILDKLKGAWGEIKNWWDTSVKKYFTPSYWIEKGKDMITGFVDGIKQKASGITDAIKGAIPQKINVPVMTTSVSTALNVVKNSNRRMSPAPMPTIAGRSIPALAAGAVIPPNREFLAVLGDQRSGTNIEAPADLIRQIVREEAGGSMELLSVLQMILEAVREGKVIVVDGTVFGRTAIRTINSVNTAAGRQMLKI
ncbi:MAG: hypothetical protein HFH27_11080 [Clostridiaceae bacterium]|nr:hypothetical protein [Clostridiaceae bacterium]